MSDGAQRATETEQRVKMNPNGDAPWWLAVPTLFLHPPSFFMWVHARATAPKAAQSKAEPRQFGAGWLAAGGCVGLIAFAVIGASLNLGVEPARGSEQSEARSPAPTPRDSAPPATPQRRQPFGGVGSRGEPYADGFDVCEGMKAAHVAQKTMLKSEPAFQVWETVFSRVDGTPEDVLVRGGRAYRVWLKSQGLDWRKDVAGLSMLPDGWLMGE